MVGENRVYKLEVTISDENITVLVQNQTTEKFGPFFDKSAKYLAPDFPGPKHFFSAPFVFCGQNFGPLATLTGSRKLVPRVLKVH